MSNEAVRAEIDGVINEFDAVLEDYAEVRAVLGSGETLPGEQAIIQAKELLLAYRGIV